MQLGMNVGLGPGDIALDGTYPPVRKGTQPLHNFRPMPM